MSVNKTSEVFKFVDSLNEKELKRLMRELIYTVDVNFDFQNWIYDIYVNNNKKEFCRKTLSKK